MYENYACKTELPNGETVELFSGDNSFQTTAYMVKFDNVAPKIADISYFTDSTLNTPLTDVNKWLKRPVTARVTCFDTSGQTPEESTSCACAKVVDAGAATALWSQ
jgi:hypothetical protein